MGSTSEDKLLTSLSFQFFNSSLTYSTYRLLRTWLQCEPISFYREPVDSSLIHSLTLCLPPHSNSLILYQMWQWVAMIVSDLSPQAREEVKNLFSNPTIQERLTIAFVNYHIPQENSLMPVQDCTSSID